MHDGGMYGMPFHWLYWLVALAVVAFAIALMLRAAGGAAGDKARTTSALDVLEQRYARGEIGRDEYLEKRKDLGAHG